MYIFLVTIFIFIIAIGIHKKTHQAVAPPIYDPVSYYSKSQIVWSAIDQRNWKSAFDQLPQRPPGTALILYPFGFTNSIQSFLFRSTMAPIVFWGLALMLIIVPLVKDLNIALAGAALSTGLLSLPIFYHFEFPIDISRSFKISLQWGLVDVLQSSIAALALGLVLTGARKRISSLVILAWLIGAYTFFIKPSGILVIGCLFFIYAIEEFINWKKEKQSRNDITFRFFVLLGVGITIASISCLFALKSGYLSKDVVKTAVIGQKIVIKMAHQPLLKQLGLLVIPIFGYWWAFSIFVTILISLGIAINSLFKWRQSDLSVRFVGCLVIFLAALYWWVNIAGEEHRYLFPFIMIIMAWLIIPFLFNILIKLRNKSVLIGCFYCLVPAFVIIFLLNVKEGSISSKVERFFGYNLDSGQYLDEVGIGRFLIEESKKTGKTLNIYSFGNYHVGAVEMMGWVNSIENSNKVHPFSIFRVNNWINPGIKSKQVLASDYFIIEKGLLFCNLPEPNTVLSWQREEDMLTQFIKSCGTNAHSGITLIQEGPVYLYKVIKRKEFATAFNRWVSSIKWSDDFWDRNSYERGDFDAPGLKTLEVNSVRELMSKSLSQLSEVNFGEKITLLGLWRKTEEVKKGGGEILPSKNEDDVLTFLFRAEQEIPPKYEIFIHLMDMDKKVIFQHDFQIDPDCGAIPAGTYWKSLVKIPESELTKSVFLGFGAYIPNKDGSFLQSNSKQSDWNGNRVLMRINPYNE
jgi:hypothetical protein